MASTKKPKVDRTEDVLIMGAFGFSSDQTRTFLEVTREQFRLQGYQKLFRDAPLIMGKRAADHLVKLAFAEDPSAIPALIFMIKAILGMSDSWPFERARRPVGVKDWWPNSGQKPPRSGHLKAEKKKPVGKKIAQQQEAETASDGTDWDDE